MPKYDPFPFGNPASVFEKESEPYSKELNFAKRTAFNPDDPYEVVRKKNESIISEKYGHQGDGEVFSALTPGDPDEVLRKYFPSQPISSAGSEKARADAREKARQVLSTYPDLPDADKKVLQEIGEFGFKEQAWKAGLGGFLSFLDIIDTPGELIRAAIADADQIDQKRGGEEITFGDYLSILTSDNEALMARHSEEFVRQMGSASDFGIEGKILAEARRGVYDVDWEPTQGKPLLAAEGFLYDVLLDPTTYATFGLGGIGKRAAIEGLTAIAVNGGKKTATTAAAAKLGGSAGVAAGRTGWKGAAEHLLAGGSADELSGVAGRAARRMEERIASEEGAYMEKFMSDVLDDPDFISPLEYGGPDALRAHARKQILLEERQAIEILEGAALTKGKGLLNDLGDLGDEVVFGTAFEKEVSEIASLAGRSQHKTLFRDFKEYVEEGAEFGGGLKLMSPIYRKRLPMVDLGFRTNSPGRDLVRRAVDALPGSSADHLRSLGNRISSNRRFVGSTDRYIEEQGKRTSAWFADTTSRNHALVSDAGVRLQGAIGELKGAVHSIEEIGKRNGMSRRDVERIGVRMMNGDLDVLNEIPVELQQELVQQTDGIRGVLETIHAVAEQKGMSIGKIENFVPLVADPRYNKIIESLADSGRSIDVDTASTPSERLGMEVLAQYVAAAQGRGRAVKRFGESQHANSRITTATAVSPTGGLDPVMHLDRELLGPVLDGFNIKHWDHETLNAALTDAMDVLARQNKLDARQVRKLDGQPLSTDLALVLDSYVSSMTNAIQMMDAGRIFQKAGFIVDEASKVSVTRTLKHVNDAVNSQKHPVMRMLDDIAESVEEGAAENVHRWASAMEDVTIGGGWTLKVPAAVIGTKPFDQTVKKLRRIYDQVNRNIRQSEAVVHRHMDDLIAKGVHPEVAARMSLAQSHGEFLEVIDEVRRIADEQATELRVLAAEQAAINVHKVSPKVAVEQLQAAALEAERIRAGAVNAVADMEEQFAKKLNVRIDTTEARALDLRSMPAPDGGGGFFDWMARKGEQTIDEAGIARWKPVDDLSPEELAAAVTQSNPQLARRATENLVDQLEVVNLTIDDVVKFGNPSSAARNLEVLARKLENAGYDPSELMSAELRGAVMDVEAAEELYDAVRFGGAGDTIGLTPKQAGQNLAEAKANLVIQAEELIGNQSLIHERIEHVLDQVTDLVDDDMFSAKFVEVWGAAIHKVGNIKKGPHGNSFADAMREQGVESVGQTKLYRQGNKGLMRDRAIQEIAWYHEMVGQSLDLNGYVSLGVFDESTLGRVTRALRSGDMEVLVGHENVLNAILKDAWPTLDATIKVRPSGAIVLEHAAEVPVWVTFDDVVEELRQVVPGGETMNQTDLMLIAMDAYREAPEIMEGASDKLSAWFRSVDGQGGLDFDAEAYEELKLLASELDKAAVVPASQTVKKSSRVVKQEAGAAALNKVLDAIDKASGGSGAATKAAPPSQVDRFSDEIEDALLDGDVVVFGSQNPTRQTVFSGEGGLTWDVERGRGFARRSGGEGSVGHEAVGEGWVYAVRVSDLPEVAQRRLREVRGEGRLTDIEQYADLFPAGKAPKVPIADAYWTSVHGTPPPGAAADAASAAEELAENTVKGAVGPKRLVNIYEENVAALRAAFPSATVDQVRSLVDHTVGLRHAKMPKDVLDRQMKLRGPLWVPLDEAMANVADDIVDLVAEARATRNLDLEVAAEDMRWFSETLERLDRFGDDLNAGGPRQGFGDLQPVDGDFVELLEAAQERGQKAIDSVRRVSEEYPDLLNTLNLPLKDAKPATVNRWADKAQKRLDSWKPIEVEVPPHQDFFVDLERVGVGGIFDGKKADTYVALLLENMAGHMAAAGSAAGQKALIENVHGFNKWWRAAVTVGRPTFVPRNLVGGVFNGMIIGVGARHYAYTAQNIMLPLRRIKNGTSSFAEEIANAPRGVGAYLEGLQRSNVLGSGYAATSLNHLRSKTPARQLINPASTQNALFRAGGNLMETSEDFLRSAAFIANYDPRRPASAWSAKAMTLAAHFDYADLTAWERSIKRFAPFFTWTRNNVPLQLRTMYEKPGIYTKYRHFTANLDSTYGVDDDEHPGNRYRGAMAASLGKAFSLGEGSEFWANAVFDPDLPFKDIEELFGAATKGPFGLLGWATGSLSPVLTAPVDWSANQDYKVVAPTGLASIIRFLDPLLPGTTEVGLDGSILVDPRTRDVANLLTPGLNEWSEVLGFAPSNGPQQTALGYNVTDGIDQGEANRARVLRLARSIGLNFDTPNDDYSAFNDANYNIIDEITERAFRSGDAVSDDDRDQVLDAISARQGG